MISRSRTTRRRNPSRARGPLACALGLLWAAGCYYEPAPVPVAPPPPRALSVTAQRGQSHAQQNRDNLDCQSMASGQATSSDTWAQIFTACMGGRGYLVQ
jgi:hypothetical protein